MRHSDARLGAVGVGRRCRVDVDVDVERLVRVAQRHDAGGSHGGALLVVDVGIGVDRHLRRRFGLFLFSTQTPEMNRVNRVIQNPTKMSDSDSSEQLATLNVDVEKKTNDDEEDRCVRGLECVSIFV